METKFTKGPWKTFKNYSGMFEVCCQGEYDLSADDICMYSPTVCMIGNVTYALGENKNPEKNAHLIAAAPEMYGMLENINCFLNEDGLQTNGLAKEIAKIPALLERARGE
tara:strand:- start:14922 stop:15251 length:330 start_codon:yes stop_codon:yes gene_type:complete